MPEKNSSSTKSARKHRLEQANTVLFTFTLSVKRVQPRHSNSRGVARSGHPCQSPTSDPRRLRRRSHFEPGHHLRGGACKPHWATQGIFGWKNLILPHHPNETMRLCG